MIKLERPTPLEWAYVAVGLVLCWRYVWLLDDSFVYFRYVDNFLFLDVGLVYNAGEYVEGFSSPLWTLLLLLLRATTASYYTIVVLLASVLYLLFAYLLIVANRALSPESPRLNLPLAYLGLNYAVLSYFSSGVDTPLVQVSAVVYALYVLSPHSRALQVVLGTTPLVRHELALPLLLVFAWGWYRTRRFPLLLVASTALVCGSWMVFRVVYYADLFPVTFYLKDMVDVKQGLLYVNDTLSPYRFYLLALLGVGLVRWLRDKDVDLRLAERGVMLLLALSVTLYVVKIGGDARHYRYLAFPFCLAVCSLGGLAEHALKEALPRLSGRWVAGLGLLVALASFSFYPRQMARHPAFHPIDKHRQVELINDAIGHRRNLEKQRDGFSKRATPELQRTYRDEHSPFAYKKTMTRGWCADNYFAFDQRVIHVGGLTDGILARVDVPAERPGHKAKLRPLAVSLVRIHSRVRTPGVGMYRRLVEKGRAPRWIVKNLDSIEIVERKIYNQHHWGENLKLAFTFPDPIVP